MLSDLQERSAGEDKWKDASTSYRCVTFQSQKRHNAEIGSRVVTSTWAMTRGSQFVIVGALASTATTVIHHQEHRDQVVTRSCADLDIASTTTRFDLRTTFDRIQTPGRLSDLGAFPATECHIHQHLTMAIRSKTGPRNFKGLSNPSHRDPHSQQSKSC